MTKSDGTVATLSPAELEKRVQKAIEHLDAIEALFPSLVALTDEERRASDGRFRQGEAKVLQAVLDVADHTPGAFQVLADKDGGKDPKKFETDVLRDALLRSETLDTLANELETLARDVRDTQLALAGRARRIVLAAYEIAKPLAKHDAVVRTKLAGTIDFYSAPARLAAKTRAQRKATGNG
jgi:hypothetical protein